MSSAPFFKVTLQPPVCGEVHNEPKHTSKTKNDFKVISHQPRRENREVLWRKIIINHMVYAIHTLL